MTQAHAASLVDIDISGVDTGYPYYSASNNNLSVIALSGWTKYNILYETTSGTVSLVSPISGGEITFINSISDDGATVAGYGYDASFADEGFISINGVTSGLTLPAGAVRNYVYSLSGDGSTVVGYSRFPGFVPRAFRWHAGTMSLIGILPGGFSSYAADTSYDGSVVVGASTSASGVRAFRWEVGVMSDLGALPGGTASYAQFVSDDGAVVVGYSDTGTPFLNSIFRWESGVMTNIGQIDVNQSMNALWMNRNGDVIVGYGGNASANDQAWRWTQTGGLEPLGVLTGGFQSRALGATSDGSVVVGWSNDSSGINQAVLWLSSATQPQMLSDYLTARNVSVTNWELTSIRAISENGEIVVGEGEYNNNVTTFIANLTGAISSINDFSQSLNTVVTAGRAGFSNTQVSLRQTVFAARNARAIAQPVVISDTTPWQLSDIATAAGGEQPLQKYMTGLSLYAVGNMGFGQNNTSGSHDANGTVGVTKDISDAFTIGAGIIGNDAVTKLDFSGHSRMTGRGVAGFATFDRREGLRVLSTLVGTKVSVDTTRGYTNGAGLDSSSGNTDGWGYGSAVQIGWSFVQPQHKAVLTPFVEGRYSQLSLEAYDETGGSFAASYNKQKQINRTGRLGVEMQKAVTPRLQLTLTGAVAHQFDDKGGTSFTADVSGLTQTLGGTDTSDQTWGEASAAMRWQLNDKVMLNSEVATRTGDRPEPAVSVMAGLSIRF